PLCVHASRRGALAGPCLEHAVGWLANSRNVHPPERPAPDSRGKVLPAGNQPRLTLGGSIMKPARLVALLTSALTLTAIAPGTSSAASGLCGSPGSSVVGHVYVNDNTASENTVAAFDRRSDGSLTPIPGSPFRAGGAGTGAGVGSQGALQESADGRYLLAVDA